MSGDRSPPKSPTHGAGGALWAGVGCFVLWSGLSVLFMGLAHYGAEPWEILADRCLWSLPWAAAIVLATRHGPEVMALTRRIKDALDPDGILNPGAVL